MQTAPSSWVTQQTARGIGSNRTRLYVDVTGDLYGQFENNSPKKIASLSGAGSSSSDSVPVGAVFQWIGTIAPDGYLLCDGRSASGYPKLNALLNPFGGKTPDLRGRYVIGSSSTTPSYTTSFPGPLSLASTGGRVESEIEIRHLPEHSHEIDGSGMPPHSHTFDIPNHSHRVTTLTSQGHSHTLDTPATFSGDAVEAQDASAASWVPTTTTDDSSITWPNAQINSADGDAFVCNSSVWGSGSETGAEKTVGGLSEMAFNPTSTPMGWQLEWDGYSADDAYAQVHYSSTDWGLPSDNTVGSNAEDLDFDHYFLNDIDHVHTMEGQMTPAACLDLDHLYHHHTIDSAEHYHSVDIDLSASTSSTNNGIGWVAQMAATGNTNSDGFIDDASDSDAIDGDAGGATNLTTDSTTYDTTIAPTQTSPAGSSNPDTVETLPPYIALNFIIKHD